MHPGAKALIRIPCGASPVLACLTICVMAALLPAYAGAHCHSRKKAPTLDVMMTCDCILGTLLPSPSGLPKPPSSAFLFPASNNSRKANMLKYVAVVLTWNVCANSSMAVSSNMFFRNSWTPRPGTKLDVGPRIPEFATSRLMNPTSLAMVSTAACSDSFDVMSHCSGIRLSCYAAASSSLSLRRPRMYTLEAPADTRALAIIRPIPGCNISGATRIVVC